MPGDVLDLNAYDPEFRMRLLTSLMGSLNSRFVQTFRAEEFTEASGKIPYLPQRATLGHRRAVKTAINGRPQERQAEVSSVPVSYDFKYSAAASITLLQLQGFKRLQNADALTEYLLTKCAMDIAVDLDLDGKELLTDTVVNETQAATAVWTNTSTARPQADFEAACDKVGKPDICWLGLDYARLLSRLDGYKADRFNYAAADTAVPLRAVAEQLMMRHGFKEVVIDNEWYNGSNPAQTIGKARLFDGVCWVGYRDHVIVVENSDYRDSELSYRRPEQDYYAWMTAMFDFARAEKAAGCVITGITA